MILLAFLAAVSGTLHFGDPVGNVSEWIRDSDNSKYPLDGAVLFKVLFNREGIPDRCVVVKRTGDAGVEPLVCSLVFKRFRSKPSLGADGQPTYMVFERAAVFSSKGGGSPIKRSTLMVTDTTGSLRAKDGPKPMALAVAVDENGAILKCEPGQWAKGEAAKLAEAACLSLPSSWKSAPEQNAAGQPISYLQGFEIEFRPSDKSAL